MFDILLAGVDFCEQGRLGGLDRPECAAGHEKEESKEEIEEGGLGYKSQRTALLDCKLNDLRLMLACLPVGSSLDLTQ